MLVKALELAAQINHPITAAVFAAVLALIALLVLSKEKKRLPSIAWILGGSILILGVSPLIAYTYLDSRGIYRVRIEILSSAETPVHDVQISSSAGGELEETDAGWEFKIPREELPTTREVTFRATQKDAFLGGQTVIKLQNDYFPQLVIQLAPLPSVSVNGMVEDENGRPIEGARVWVLSYDQVATTGSTGGFTLSAHAADGEQITLVAQKGSDTTQTFAIAGRTAEIILRKPHR